MARERQTATARVVKTMEDGKKMSKEARQNPFLFVVGCPRSGTTLLQRMLNAHSHIAITHETHWIPKFFEKRCGLTQEGLVTPELISRLTEHSGFRKLGISDRQLRSLLPAKEPTSYGNFVTTVFELYGKAQGKPLVGDKTPGYVRDLVMLHTLWPNARFVHLIRDGRDVCLCAIDWKNKADSLARRFPTWREDPVSTAAVWWRWNVQLGREAGRTLGPSAYYEMRYESLVADPSTECRKLCSFLDVPYSEAMLRFYEGKMRTEPGLSAKHAWLPVTQGLRDWKSQMSSESRQRFEAVAGDLLEELGYPRTVSRPEPKVESQASLVFQAFTQDALSSRGRRLPKVW